MRSAIILACVLIFAVFAYAGSGYELGPKWGSFGWEDGEMHGPAGIVGDSSGCVYVVDSKNNRVQKFEPNGKFITKWGGKGSKEGQFNFPQGIAVDKKGCFYVTDKDNHRVQKFNCDGKFINQWGSQGKKDGQFECPMGIAVDDSGYVYVTDYYNNRVQKFSSDGLFLEKWGMQGSDNWEFNCPNGITVDKSGYVYVADEYNHRIQKFSRDGAFAGKWGTQGKEGGQFNRPCGITVDKNGYLYVVDRNNRRIQKFDNEGNFIKHWGSDIETEDRPEEPCGIFIDGAGNVYLTDSGRCFVRKYVPGYEVSAKMGIYGKNKGELDSPKGVAVDGAGNIYVVDRNNHRVQKFDGKGKLLSKIESGFNFPAFIALDNRNNVYVTDWNNHCVQKFDPKGNLINIWGEYGTKEKQFIHPEGIAVDCSGFVYVVDRDNHRVQKFNKDGLFVKSWGGEGDGSGRLKNPVGVATDRINNVYVADRGNGKVQKFEPDGKFLREWSGLDSPYGITVDGMGNVFVADITKQCIRKYDSRGGMILEIGGLSRPAGLTADLSGDIYVSDENVCRIVKYVTSGYSAIDEHAPDPGEQQSSPIFYSEQKEKSDTNAFITTIEDETKKKYSDANLRYKLAKLYFEEKEYEKALEGFEIVAKEKPELTGVYLYLGMVYERRANPEKAYDMYALAIEKSVFDRESATKKRDSVINGILRDLTSRLEKAKDREREEILFKILKYFPYDGSYFEKLLSAYESRAGFEEQEKILAWKIGFPGINDEERNELQNRLNGVREKIIWKDGQNRKNSAGSRLALAKFYEKYDRNSAEPEFLYAGALSPDSAGIYSEIGLFYLKWEKLKKADEWFRKALELEKDGKRKALLEKMISSARLEEMVQDEKEYKDLSDVYMDICPEKAVMINEKCVKEYPENKLWLFSLAESYEKTGDLEKALYTYEKYLTAEPEDKDASNRYDKLRKAIGEDFNFDSMENAERFNKCWRITFGHWKPENKKLLCGGTPALVWYHKQVGKVKLSFDVTSDKNIGVILSGKDDVRWDSGYFCVFGWNNNKVTAILKNGVTVMTGKERIKPGKKYNIEVRNDSRNIEYLIDGKSVMSVSVENDYEEGGLGIVIFNEYAVIDNLKLEF